MRTSKDYKPDTEIAQRYTDHPPVRIIPESEACKHKLQIKIELDNRPQYTGGHGPPLTKLLLQPEHEKKNLMISDYKEKERGKAVYIVCLRKDRSKNREVSPEDILKWVSQRTLEEFSVREYERYEEISRVKEQKEKAEEYAATHDRNGNPRSSRKKAVGRPRKSRQASEVADDDNLCEVTPAKRNRAARRVTMVVAGAEDSKADAEPSLSQQPSLSHRPSLSQPLPNLKRKVSQVLKRERTPGEITDGDADELLDVSEARRQPRELSIRERPSSPLQARRNSSPEARARRTPTVEILNTKSPSENLSAIGPSHQFSKGSNEIRKKLPAPTIIPWHASGNGNSSKKQSSSSSSIPAPATAGQTRIIPGTSKPMSSIIAGKQPINSLTEPPKSSSKIMPPERRNLPPPPSPSISKRSRK